jgi:hypothetical protein
MFVKCIVADVVDYDKVPLEEAYEKLQNYIKSCNNANFLTAVDLIKECLQEYRFLNFIYIIYMWSMCM